MVLYTCCAPCALWNSAFSWWFCYTSHAIICIRTMLIISAALNLLAYAKVILFLFSVYLSGWQITIIILTRILLLCFTTRTVRIIAEMLQVTVWGGNVWALLKAGCFSEMKKKKGSFTDSKMMLKTVLKLWEDTFGLDIFNCWDDMRCHIVYSCESFTTTWAHFGLFCEVISSLLPFNIFVK